MSNNAKVYTVNTLLRAHAKQLREQANRVDTLRQFVCSGPRRTMPRFDFAISLNMARERLLQLSKEQMLQALCTDLELVARLVLESSQPKTSAPPPPHADSD